MSARTAFAAALEQALDEQPKWKVIDHWPSATTTIATGYTLVPVFRSRVGRSPVHGGYANTLDVWVLIGNVDVATIEDDLDERLAIIVPILEAAGCEFDIERGVYAETWHGWHITVPYYTDTP